MTASTTNHFNTAPRFFNTVSRPSAPAMAAPFIIERGTPRPSAAFIKPKPCRKTEWQHRVCQSTLPCSTKGILLQLSVEWMDAQGGSCFPSQEQIMERLGISRPALTRHLKLAVEGGYLEIWHYGRGIRNRRYNYQARFPDDPPPPPAGDGKESCGSPGGDGQDLCGTLTIAKLNHVQESAAAFPEPLVDATTVETLSDEIDWIGIAKEVRPDLSDEQIEGSLQIFRLHGKRTVQQWRIWIARERAHTPRPVGSIAKPAPEAGRYTNWEAGQVAPICQSHTTPEQAQAQFEANMQRYGAVQQPDGTWTKPKPILPPIPLGRPVIDLAAVESPPPSVPPMENAVPEIPESVIPAPTPPVEPPQPPARRSPLADVLETLRRAPGPETGKPAALPWRPIPKNTGPSAAEMAQVEAELRELEAQRRAALATGRATPRDA